MKKAGAKGTRTSTTPKKEKLHRLHRIAGQIQGIARMIDEERPAGDILTQIKAVRSALNVVESTVLRQQFRSGVKRALVQGESPAVEKALLDLYDGLFPARRTKPVSSDEV